MGARPGIFSLSGILRGIVGRLVGGLVGIGLCLFWWSLNGGDGERPEPLEKLPAVVMAGDGGDMAIELSVNQAATLYASFFPDSGDTPIEVQQALEPGVHQFETQLPAAAYTSLTAAIHQPGTGAEISWRVEVNGSTVRQDSRRAPMHIDDDGELAVGMDFDSPESAGVYMGD